MNIAIVGTGYVGLVSGTCFADTGANVTCVDVDANKIERLKNGDIPIYEPGLDELVKKNYAAGCISLPTWRLFSTTCRLCSRLWVHLLTRMAQPI